MHKNTIQDYTSFTEGRDESYLNEVTKQNILDDLKRIERYAKSLYRIVDNSKSLDNETKQNILDLMEMSKNIFDMEVNKELKNQKENGKEFLSDEDIDDLFDGFGT